MDDELGMCRLCGEYRNDGCKRAPAQEEKEMIKADEHRERIEKEETAADLRERWDRAYFAALTSCACSMAPDHAIHHAEAVASASIRRRTTARDKIIAEVVV